MRKIVEEHQSQSNELNQKKNGEHQFESQILMQNQSSQQNFQGWKRQEKQIVGKKNNKLIKWFLNGLVFLLFCFLSIYLTRKFIAYLTYYYQTPQDVPYDRRVAVIITTCCGRYNLLKTTLQTFIEKNTFPSEEIIIVNDGPLQTGLLKVYEPFKQKNISLLVTGKKFGKLKSIDMAYASIQTPYIFHIQDGWEFKEKGFIEKSMKQLEKDSNVLQVSIQKNHLSETKLNSNQLCFSFAPGLKRLKDYKQIGSYSKYIQNKSIEIDEDQIKRKISNFYHQTGKYLIQLENKYINKLKQQKQIIEQVIEKVIQFNNSSKQIKQFNDYGIHYNSRQEVPQNRRISVVITTCCGRYDLLPNALSSFFKQSTFPYQQIFLVNDGQIVQDLVKNYLPYKHNISLLVTGKKTGQLRAIDMIYLGITTPYIFHFQDDCQFIQRGFIEESINWLQNNPKIIQPWIQKHALPVEPVTRKVITDEWSISFQPGLKRLSDYKQIQSYSIYTKNSSYGYGAGSAECFLSQYYVKKGGYAIQTQIEYTLHKGSHNRLGRWNGNIQIGKK